MMFTKTVIALALALSASAISVPHGARSGHHRALAHRAPVAESEPIFPEVKVKPKRKRSLNKRCAPANSTVSASATTSDVPTDTSSWVAPTSSWVAPSSDSSSWVDSSAWVDPSTWALPTSSWVAPTWSWVAPTTTDDPTTWSPPAPTPTSGSGPSWLYGEQWGDAGLGACGITNSDSDYIIAVSEDLFDNYPGYDGVNPNNNPVCNKQIIATYGGKSITVTVTDRCTGCNATSIDFTPTAFSQLADQSLGRIHLTWVWA
ncbi:RlpA-like double-psi beta-barrel-protein domain-containing protein-containing protein [Rhodofomes roseus]|uniref:RlpA-like double-psi beta-barrel-protein domain-containing protein-containing protein n=1 Tax=Rhodofomes roseus TaxID=34475 RepID=A0ABQ8KGX7_9APHY|nr:RlpA-like double-psi beta-barrel-protein domain-containing protein-containing protein [Rhodofomes roseus]KAH9837114.1 RlpA-like double-psi beta-barrel-protein domain-containing protein-containing protein [Rhodofomes roseus]